MPSVGRLVSRSSFPALASTSRNARWTRPIVVRKRSVVMAQMACCSLDPQLPALLHLIEPSNEFGVVNRSAPCLLCGSPIRRLWPAREPKPGNGLRAVDSGRTAGACPASSRRSGASGGRRRFRVELARLAGGGEELGGLVAAAGTCQDDESTPERSACPGPRSTFAARHHQVAYRGTVRPGCGCV